MHGSNSARYHAGSASRAFVAGLMAFVLILALALQGAVVIATPMTAVQAAREGARWRSVGRLRCTTPATA
ncbi:hypothetical protein [Kallotenue papyrolyticum]|uniref:hypothetical protein n=1 Tax=Kallotenue papyrolyticum TaxID=1325125 RepID=UPI00047855D8|nr:hypothetical protein [Kallotenue papyrolyticum]